MQEMIIEIVNNFGYIGIIVLIAVENIFPPIPSEVILTFSGFLTTYTHLNVWGVILAATIGSVVGAFILYYVGHLLTNEKLMRILDGRVGKILHFNKDDVQGALNWFNRKGKGSVFFCRFVPIMRSMISIPAGMAGMELGFFTIMTTLGSLIWNIILVHLGAFAGASWEYITTYIDGYKHWVIIVFIILIVVGYIVGKGRNHGSLRKSK